MSVSVRSEVVSGTAKLAGSILVAGGFLVDLHLHWKRIEVSNHFSMEDR